MLTSLLWMAAQVLVRGEVTCPAASTVAVHLAALLPAGEGGPSDRADIAVAAEGIVIELRKEDGTLIGERRLDRSGSCDDMAEAAAVVLATWETRTRSGWDGVSTIDVGPQPPPRAKEHAEGARAEDVTPAVPSRRRVIEIGGGVMESWSGSDAAPGAFVETLIPVGSWPLRFHAGLALWTSHETPFGAGSARWSRMGGGLGAAWVVEGPGLFFSVGGDFFCTLLRIEGDGYAVDRSQQSFDPGIFGGVRAGFHWGVLSPYAGATIGYWLRPQGISVDGDPSVSHLQRVEPSLELGVLLRAGG